MSKNDLAGNGVQLEIDATGELMEGITGDAKEALNDKLGRFFQTYRVPVL